MALINYEKRCPPAAYIGRGRSLAFHLIFVLAGPQAGSERSGVQADIKRVLPKLGFSKGKPALIFK